MTADTITITAGRPDRGGDTKDFAGPDGTYTAALIAVGESVTEKSSLADAKGDGTWTYRDWSFAIDDDSEWAGQVIGVRANTRSTGPNSKQFKMIAALVGRTPPAGAEIDIQRHLVGRQCLVSIGTNDSGYPVAETFMALPPARPANGPGAPPVPAPAPVPPAAAPASAPAPAPAPAAAAPAPAPAAAPTEPTAPANSLDSLPF